MVNVTAVISPALLKGQHAKQLPFALSKTINETLKVAQGKFLETLPTRFHLRSKGAPHQKPGTALGFNIKFSSKTNLVGTLGSRADWWPLQETGGTKRVSGHSLAIPFAARPSIQSVIPSKNKPRRLLVRAGDAITRRGRKTFIAKRDAKGFILKLKDGRRGVFVRQGDRDLRLWYLLQPTATVKPALGFFSTTQAAVAKNLNVIFNREFTKAVESST